MEANIISNSPNDTWLMGKLFSKLIKYGDIMLLSGELGGGKTTFISGIASGLGIEKELTSPSFTIVNEYDINGKKFIHADLYRLNNVNDINMTGLDDYIYDEKNITCIEWGDKFEQYIEKEFIAINFKYDLDSEEKRILKFKSNFKYWHIKLKKFQKIINKNYHQEDYFI